MPKKGEPAKWLKYQLLVAFGLQSQSELDETIRRFPASSREDFLECLHQDLYRDAQAGLQRLTVVKLVSLAQYGQLPNYRLRRPADLEGLGRFLNSNLHPSHVELWSCRTLVGSSVGTSIAGRVVVNRANSGFGQLAELVWNRSPRLIESLHGSSRTPHARAHRPGWGWSYRIDKLREAVDEGLTRTRMRAEFAHWARRFETLKAAAADLEAFCGRVGALELSLEFKMVDARLSIIDFDTEDDRAVVNEYLRFL